MMSNQSYLNIKVEDYATQEDDLILEVDDFTAYDFPREAVIPEADYIALVVEARVVNKVNHATLYDVYFDMIKLQDWYSWNDGYRDSVPYYHMIQRFKKDSRPERIFRSYMADKLNCDKFSLTKIVGVTGAFKLVYSAKSEMGSIGPYFNLDVDAECFEIPADRA